ncbi:hypothetical protein WM22_29565 [Burkholderia ubonensis]|nr:hypothetical protein WJ97_20795 [Burkholderia ubonensis]KWK96218.1 hypothetical protein WM19_18610 [Burkholderia ubonensis]KWK99464.1 hypothetical protein WM20_13190 [Burkholderia ubonensis]KWN26679.1 hypothetical protein WM22_29565 [Burkholderia ubonensis]ODQ22554.1 hypothetical protein BGV64_30325 [Burkholderia ubonensis]
MPYQCRKLSEFFGLDEQETVVAFFGIEELEDVRALEEVVLEDAIPRVWLIRIRWNKLGWYSS